MWLLNLAWKNLWRNRTRTFITMAAVFFAVLLSVLAASLSQGVFNNLIKNVVGFYTGYVQVHKQGYQQDQVLDNSFASDFRIAASIQSHPNVTGLTPRLETFALASSESVTKGCMVVGIDPEREDGVTSLRQKLAAGRYLNADDHGVLMGSGLAERLQLKAGDTVVMIGQGYHGAMAAGKYEVAGLLKFGAPNLNDGALFMPLPLAQEMYGAEGMLTSWVLSLQHPDEANTTAAEVGQLLGKDFEVMSWGELLPDIKQHIDSDTNSMKYIQGVLYLLVCFGIFGTLLMMMVERRFELGMLTAIGMKKSMLMLLIGIESMLTILAGCLMGMLVALPVVYLLSVHPLRIAGQDAVAYERFGFEAIFPASLDGQIFLSQGMMVLAAALLLALYPVYKVWRLNAIQAMKR